MGVLFRCLVLLFEINLGRLNGITPSSFWFVVVSDIHQAANLSAATTPPPRPHQR